MTALALLRPHQRRRVAPALGLTLSVMLMPSLLADWRAWNATRSLAGVMHTWANTQHHALALLVVSAQTGSPDDFASFERAIDRAQVLRSVRVLLEQPVPDDQEIAQRLLAAGNEPAAVAGFAKGVRSLVALREFAAFLGPWEYADRQIEDVRRLAGRLRGHGVDPSDTAAPRLTTAEALIQIQSASGDLRHTTASLATVVAEAGDRLRWRVLGRGALAAILALGPGALLLPARRRRGSRTARPPARRPSRGLEPARENTSSEPVAEHPVALGHAAAEGLREAESDSSDVLGQLPVSLWTTDHDLRYTLVSGQPLPGVMPEPGMQIHDSYDSRARPIEALRTHEDALRGVSGAFYHELDGRVYRCLVRPLRDRAGAIAGTLGVGLDITDHEHSKVQLEHLASRDSLTNLYNRRHFEEELAKALSDSARRRSGGALLWCDLDHFKEINDSLGHSTGDQFLRRVAEAFRVQVGRGEILARLGGDEFGVLLPEATLEAAKSLARRLLDSVRRETAAVKARGLSTTASVGIVAFPEHGSTTEDLLTRADVAMYQAKREGRGRIEVFSYDEHLRPFLARVQIADQVRACIEQDRMELYLEPICKLQDCSVLRYEALLRVPDGEGGMMAPDTFLEICTSFGLMHDIDRWVIRKACELLRYFRHRGVVVPIEINLSGAAFGDESILTLIGHEVRSGGINPGSLILEISEKAAVADLELARDFIEQLRRVGCQFAVDDFGAGFSSFGYLRHLPVRYLKIDGSFIRGLHGDPINQSLVRAIVAMSRSLGVTPVAEFVEDRWTAEWLLAESCRFGQGSYTGLARPVEAVLADYTTAVAARWRAAGRRREGDDAPGASVAGPVPLAPARR